MSIEPRYIASSALEAARLELTSRYPTKAGMAFYFGRTSACAALDDSLETLSAHNEVRYLTADYAYRHKLCH